MAQRAERSCATCGTETAALQSCAACKRVWYCGKECQTSHWPEHWPQCAAYSQQAEREADSAARLRQLNAAAPAARADDPRLVILENIGPFAEANTWHQEVGGVKLLTNEVNTVRRVALMSDRTDAVSPSTMRVEQSLLLHSTGATITSGPPDLKSNKLLYKNLETTVHELRANGTRGGATASADGVCTRGGATASADGVGCQQCFGVTTFKFKFNITGQGDLVGGSTHTLLRLRYSVVGHPEVFVDTLPFRLVSKVVSHRKPAAEDGRRRPGAEVQVDPGRLRAPMTVEEVQWQAKEEGVTLLTSTDNGTGYLGVHHLAGRNLALPYQARVMRDCKQVHLGCFATKEEAALEVALSTAADRQHSLKRGRCPTDNGIGRFAQMYKDDRQKQQARQAKPTEQVQREQEHERLACQRVMAMAAERAPRAPLRLLNTT